MLKTAAFLVTTVVAASTLIAQQPPAGQAPPGGGQRGGGGGMRGPAPIAYEDHTGFQQIFDGKSLKNWDGDPAFWRSRAARSSARARRPTRSSRTPS